MKLKSAFILSTTLPPPLPPPRIGSDPNFYQKKQKIQEILINQPRRILSKTSFLFNLHQPGPMPEYKFTLSYTLTKKEDKDWFRWKPTSTNCVIIENNRYQA
jgi:hypothetical protein